MLRSACLVICLTSTAQAQVDSTYFELDFEDGVRPKLCACIVQDGSMLMERQGSFIVTSRFPFEPDDFVVDTQVRFLDDVGKTDWITIIARDADLGGAGVPGYMASISTRGELMIQRTTSDGADSTFRHTFLSELDPVNHDVRLKFRLDGESLSLSAWKSDDVAPETPQIMVEDDQHLESSYVMVVNSSFDQPPGATAAFRYLNTSPIAPGLLAGDADQDLDFDQLDLTSVLDAGKYVTGQPATWGEGDWNGAPGGEPGSPPEGNQLFDELDIIAALLGGSYLTGPYAAVGLGGSLGDGQTSLIYDATTGELAVDAVAGSELTSINVVSANGMFTGIRPVALEGAFDNFTADSLFKATFGGSFGSTSFGNILPVGMSPGELAKDLTVVGSLAGGGNLGEVTLVYVPEPVAAWTALLGVLTIVCQRGCRWKISTVVDYELINPF